MKNFSKFRKYGLFYICPGGASEHEDPQPTNYLLSDIYGSSALIYLPVHLLSIRKHRSDRTDSGHCPSDDRDRPDDDALYIYKYLLPNSSYDPHLSGNLRRKPGNQNSGSRQR